jgi:hypothetical protein
MQAMPLNAFDTFEHRYLGNTAYDIVSDEFLAKLPADEKHKLEIPWRQVLPQEVSIAEQKDSELGMAKRFMSDRNVPVGFGDLPALAGDFVESVEALRRRFEGFVQVNPKAVKWILAFRRQWFNACRWHYDHISKNTEPRTLDNCFPKVTLKDLNEVPIEPVLNETNLASTGYIPTRIEQGEFERLPGFTSLAERNKSHFPQHSWEMYIHNHHCALVLAAVPNSTSSETDKKRTTECDLLGDLTHVSKEERWYRAIIYEGFAQHFLHDSFSAGHIGVPYGTCLDLHILPPLLCDPTKQQLQHAHDTLNRIGITVVIPKMTNDKDGDFLKDYRATLEAGWTAFGDDHLFIPEASFHRNLLLRVGVESLREVFDTKTKKKKPPTRTETCKRWSHIFPIPQGGTADSNANYKCGSEPNDLSNWKSAWKSFWDWRSAGRSPDERISDPPLEGWKIMATYGPAFGKFNQLNSDGSVREAKSGADVITMELGYVRSTGWWPNYLGFGASILPEYRTSIYPLSVGWWVAPNSRFWFAGFRTNMGIRLEEGLTEENPDNRLRAQIELGNLVFEGGIEIYSPLALYVRAETLAVVWRGFGSSAQENQVTIESIFNGRGAITFGLRFDLANVF